MKHNELMAFLQAYEDEVLEINRRAREVNRQAEEISRRIRETIRNTHFKAQDDYYNAWRELEKFNERLYEGLDQGA